MVRRDYTVLLILGILALFIWLRDISWMSSGEDTLPILVALPVFFSLGRPWKFTPEERPFELPVPRLALVAVLFLLGIVAESTLLLAIAWTLILWTWLQHRIKPEDRPHLSKLLVLPIMSFPWVTLDMQQLGWYFRLSGAWATAQIYTLLGYDVQYGGTTILIDQLPISVEAACAGLNTLQSMLIAGSVVAYIVLGETKRYWPNIALLVVMAWIANTSRILLLSAVALAFGRDFALGAFHTWGGWFILVVMFVLCWLLFELQAPKPVTKSKAEP
ncbi:MAG: exosortase/archaeosortase family protein [Nitrosomonas sp.]|nr:MAG: exosortase/archaeosortase family protein [Nitrosomonas sp.]